MSITDGARTKDNRNVGELMVHKRRKRYPGVRGKVVDFIDHNFAEGRLYIRVRFQDETEICWQVECAQILREV